MDTPERPDIQQGFGDDPLEPTPEPPVAIIPVVAYEPTVQPAISYAPTPPPTPPGPPKSVAGALLLNLTGLGLGYAYLRNRGLLVATPVFTAALVTFAFLSPAAAQPWLWRGVIVGWLVVLGLHAAFLASRRAPGASQRTPVLAGAAAVAVMVAGYVGYGIAGGAVYDDGVAAQEDGDCATATSAFEKVTGPFELTLSPEVLHAQTRLTECAAYEQAVAAQKRDDHESAITLYNDFGKIHPDSVLTKYVHTNLADTHFAKATNWQPPVTSNDAQVSVDTLLMLRKDFGDTEAAKKAPRAITDVFAAATTPYAEGKFCDSLEVLTYFAGLEPAGAGEQVVAEANAYRARSLYECGLSQARENLAPQAIETIETFLTAYPNDPGVPQASSAVIAAKVSMASGVPLPVPPPLGGNDPGSIPVTFYNDSSRPVTILVAGPTAHEITLPPCGVCPESYPQKDDPAACKDKNGRPSVTTHLTPNTYYYMTVDDSAGPGSTDSVTPMVGYQHWQCSYRWRP
ncbi:outer membrane protein assembly factor BamD [Actinophytocola sp.]|uniref:outer membrane protein assembly factor BamD n=1 Tax=Actinophytocola sp. TaxID=1872138 RepID=UPI002ED30863